MAERQQVTTIEERTPRAWIVLPAAAGVIFALCAWKLSRPESRPAADDRPLSRAAAPLFDLVDQQPPHRRVRLATYLGRHRILLAFFETGPEIPADPVLLKLRDRFPAIERAGIKVFAVGTALPEDFEALLARTGPFPFPILRDPNGFACAKWGRAERDEEGELRMTPALFAIDRAGGVAWSDEELLPESDPLAAVDAAAAGELP